MLKELLFQSYFYKCWDSGVLLGMLAQEHDIVADVPGLRRAPLEIAELGFNMSFDDMTIKEVTDLFLLLGHICIGNMGMLGVCNRI